MLIRFLVVILVSTSVFASLGCSNSSGDGGYTPATETGDLCETPLAPNEPVCSAAFGDTVWAGSHRSSYAQGSSPLPGPAEAGAITTEHIELPGAPIIVSFFPFW